jgi:hypothetical protein
MKADSAYGSSRSFDDLGVLSLLNYFLSAADVWLQYLFTTGEHAMVILLSCSQMLILSVFLLGLYTERECPRSPSML